MAEKMDVSKPEEAAQPCQGELDTSRPPHSDDSSSGSGDEVEAPPKRKIIDIKVVHDMIEVLIYSSLLFFFLLF